MPIVSQTAHSLGLFINSRLVLFCLLGWTTPLMVSINGVPSQRAEFCLGESVTYVCDI